MKNEQQQQQKEDRKENDITATQKCRQQGCNE